MTWRWECKGKFTGLMHAYVWLKTGSIPPGEPEEREREHHPGRVGGGGAASPAKDCGRLRGERSQGRRSEEPARGFHSVRHERRVVHLRRGFCRARAHHHPPTLGRIDWLRRHGTAKGSFGGAGGTKRHV